MEMKFQAAQEQPFTRGTPNPDARGGLADCTADRDDAAMPWLTVPKLFEQETN